MSGIMKERFAILKRIIPFARGLERYFAILFISSLVLMFAGMLTPVFYKILVDDVILNREVHALWYVVAGYAAVYLITSGMKTAGNYASNRFLNKLVFNMRLRIWSNYLKMPLTRYNRYQVGDLKMRMDDDTNKIEEFINQQTYSYIINLLIIVSYGGVLLYLSWKLALFSVIMVPVTFFIGHVLGRNENALNEQRREVWARKDDWMLSSLQGWKEVKALCIENRERRIFTQYHHRSGILDARWINYWLLHDLILPAIKDEFIMKFALYLAGSLLVMNGDFTIGSLLIFMKFYSGFYESVNRVNECNISLNNDKPLFHRIFDVIHDKEGEQAEQGEQSEQPEREVHAERGERGEQAGQLAQTPFQGEVRLKNVTFGYENGTRHILEDVSLTITPGEKVAIVGKSGAGKTTLAKLLLGIERCRAGQILYDHTDIDSLHEPLLHRNVGAVMQDSILFNMSIKDNLKLARSRATDEEIVEACRKAHIDEFIDTLPDQYDTIIGERGVKLSGGQRQRLAIARVFLSRANIWILDEATSSLDHESERMIHDVIRNATGDKTIILIAHRLSSLLLADRVIVLKDGRIAASGHHTELLDRNEAYDELFKEQYA